MLLIVTDDRKLRREVLEETGVRIGRPIFLTEALDAEGDGGLVSLFYVAGGISPGDIDLHESAGIGVHSIGDLDCLPLAPFVSRAIRSHLMPALDLRSVSPRGGEVFPGQPGQDRMVPEHVTRGEQT